MPDLKYKPLTFFKKIEKKTVDSAIAHEKDLIDWIYFKYIDGCWMQRPYIFQTGGHFYFDCESNFSAN